MIITNRKDDAQILKNLEPYRNIFVVGCGECSTTCSTGGSEEVKSMVEFLLHNGKSVTGSCVPKAPCVGAQVRAEIASHAASVRQADAVLILSCGLGVQSFKESNRSGQPVIPGLDTVCGAVLDARGGFAEKCSMCGDCILAETAGICPVTLCPKGVSNGPCGGVSRGKCEVDREKDCAWVLIYRELERRNACEQMRKIRSPRDFRKSARPHTLKQKYSNAQRHE